MAKPTVDEGVNDPRALGLRDMMMQGGPYTPGEQQATQQVVEAADADPSIRRTLMSALAQHDDKLKAAEHDLLAAQDKVERSTWAKHFRPVLSFLFPPAAAVRSKSEGELAKAQTAYGLAEKERAQLLQFGPDMAQTDLQGRKFDLITKAYPGDLQTQARLLSGAGLPKTPQELANEGNAEVSTKINYLIRLADAIKTGKIDPAAVGLTKNEGEDLQTFAAKERIRASIQAQKDVAVHDTNARTDLALKPKAFTKSPTLTKVLADRGIDGETWGKFLNNAESTALRRNITRLATTGMVTPEVASEIEGKKDGEELSQAAIQQLTKAVVNDKMLRRDMLDSALQRVGYNGVDDFRAQAIDSFLTGATDAKALADEIEFVVGTISPSQKRKVAADLQSIADKKLDPRIYESAVTKYIDSLTK